MFYLWNESSLFKQPNTNQFFPILLIIYIKNSQNSFKFYKIANFVKKLMWHKLDFCQNNTATAHVLQTLKLQTWRPSWYAYFETLVKIAFSYLLHPYLWLKLVFSALNNTSKILPPFYFTSLLPFPYFYLRHWHVFHLKCTTYFFLCASTFRCKKPLTDTSLGYGLAFIPCLIVWIIPMKSCKGRQKRFETRRKKFVTISGPGRSESYWGVLWFYLAAGLRDYWVGWIWKF